MGYYQSFAEKLTVGQLVTMRDEINKLLRGRG